MLYWVGHSEKHIRKYYKFDFMLILNVIAVFMYKSDMLGSHIGGHIGDHFGFIADLYIDDFIGPGMVKNIYTNIVTLSEISMELCQF